MISDSELQQMIREAEEQGYSTILPALNKLQALRKGREIPEGWKLVPVEPTKEMRLASRRYVAKTKLTSGPGFYRAMLAAAPAPSE